VKCEVFLRSYSFADGPVDGTDGLRGFNPTPPAASLLQHAAACVALLGTAQFSTTVPAQEMEPRIRHRPAMMLTE
jgi:hypothetical protein